MPSNQTITLDPGESRIDRLGDGETFENLLVDQRADGASYHIRASGNGWTIRNVGWLGTARVADISWGGFHMAVEGNGHIENVFIDNRGTPTEMGGALATRGHDGVIDVHNTFIAGNGNNAFYGSNPGKTSGTAVGGDGAVRFHDCYHRDNTVSQFRIGTPGSYIENCVAVLDDPGGRRGTYPNSDSQRARCVWARHYPDQEIRNSVLYVGPDDVDPRAHIMVDCIDKSHGPQAEAVLNNTRANPEIPDHAGWAGRLFVPQRACAASVAGELDLSSYSVDVLRNGGVPTSAEMAANGEREMPPELPGGSGGGGPTSETLSITTETERADYEFTIEGTISELSGIGTGDEIVDHGDGTMTATGFVRGGEDVYSVTGPFACLSVDGADVSIVRAGEAVNPGSIADCDGDGGNGDNGDAPEPQPQSSRVLAASIGGGVAAHLIRSRLGL